MVSAIPQKRGFIQRWSAVLKKIAAIPIVFFGVGMYRAWLAIFFRFDAYPSIGSLDYFLFEGSIGIASLLLAFTATRITPLWSNNRMGVATFAAMTVGSALVAVGCFLFPSAALKLTGLIVAGAGLGSLILMWAEFYGSLNPMRVAVYHAIAIFFGEVIKWLFMGLSVPYLVFFSLVLPALSLCGVRASMRRIPRIEQPLSTGKDAKRVFPWKPILLMGVCTFSGGYGTLPSETLLAGNVAGAMCVTALVFVGVLSTAKWFNFDTIYQLAFPFFIVGFLLVSQSFTLSDQLRAFSYDAGYTMLSMFIMLIMSSLTYRFGISAVWINGIERGIRYLVELAGWAFGAFAIDSFGGDIRQVIVVGMTVVMMAVFVAVFYSERNLSAKWGITMNHLSAPDPSAAAGRLALHTADLSKLNGLTPREEEVLQLIMRGKTMEEMEQELFVAQGTIKAHMNHIYRKFGVHSRKELIEACREDA